jgi:hypothetical protein
MRRHTQPSVSSKFLIPQFYADYVPSSIPSQLPYMPLRLAFVALQTCRSQPSPLGWTEETRAVGPKIEAAPSGEWLRTGTGVRPGLRPKRAALLRDRGGRSTPGGGLKGRARCFVNPGPVPRLLSSATTRIQHARRTARRTGLLTDFTCQRTRVESSPTRFFLRHRRFCHPGGRLVFPNAFLRSRAAVLLSRRLFCVPGRPSWLPEPSSLNPGRFSGFPTPRLRFRGAILSSEPSSWCRRAPSSLGRRRGALYFVAHERVAHISAPVYPISREYLKRQI